MLSYLASWNPFRGDSSSVERPPVEDLPSARVAIIGAGMGGCFAAKFLRENGGKDLDIHIWNKKESTIGGRSAVVSVGGRMYEAGAAIGHTSNQYLLDAVKEHDLDITKDDNTIPLGIYNGTTFVLRTGSSAIVTFVKMFWRYGLTVIRMFPSVNALLRKFKRVYTHQDNGISYATVEDLLRGMDNGGEEVNKLVQISARDYFTGLGWSELAINELITGAMRINYGQSADVNAFCTYVSLAGVEDNSLWSVVGGNFKIAEKVLEASGATLHEDDVTMVTRISEGGNLKYKITTASGETGGDFDVVIVANPLNTSAINYIGFPNPIYTAASTTPYQRTVAEFVNGRINREFFGVSQSDSSFPLLIMTTEMTGEPFDFRDVAVEVPCDVTQEEKKEHLKCYENDPVRCWKLFTGKPLTEDQKRDMFLEISDEATVDWLAYPHYQLPEEFPPFVLDDGMFYINAIEKAASAMEMSAISAKNSALLAREYLIKKSNE